MRYNITRKPPTYVPATILEGPRSYGLAIGQPERNTKIVRRKANVDSTWVVAIGCTWSGTISKRTGGLGPGQPIMIESKAGQEEELEER